MLETIITESIFFYLGLLSRTFTIHRKTVEGGVSLTFHGGQTFLDKEWRGYSKWDD